MKTIALVTIILIANFGCGGGSTTSQDDAGKNTGKDTGSAVTPDAGATDLGIANDVSSVKDTSPSPDLTNNFEATPEDTISPEILVVPREVLFVDENGHLAVNPGLVGAFGNSPAILTNKTCKGAQSAKFYNPQTKNWEAPEIVDGPTGGYSILRAKRYANRNDVVDGYNDMRNSSYPVYGFQFWDDTVYAKFPATHAPTLMAWREQAEKICE